MTNVARAYDAIAPEYDSQVEGDGWMRHILHERYAALFHAGQRLLDVSCGTGIDALFLAERGIDVAGIDASPGMIARLEARVSEHDVAGRVEAHVADLSALGSWPAESFDGIVSAFAGLSTTPDLAPFAGNAARLLRPHGRLLVHMLSRTSLWERLGLMRVGRVADAARLGKPRRRAFTIGGEDVVHYLYLPNEAYHGLFSSHFQLDRAYSLGCLRPPHTVRRVHAGVVEALGWLERFAGNHRPFLNWGRFFVLEMTRR